MHAKQSVSHRTLLLKIVEKDACRNLRFENPWSLLFDEQLTCFGRLEVIHSEISFSVFYLKNLQLKNLNPAHRPKRF